MRFQCGIKRIIQGVKHQIKYLHSFFIFLIILQFLLVSKAILVSAHLKNYTFKATFDSRSDTRTSIITRKDWQEGDALLRICTLLWNAQWFFFSLYLNISLSEEQWAASKRHLGPSPGLHSCLNQRHWLECSLDYFFIIARKLVIKLRFILCEIGSHIFFHIYSPKCVTAQWCRPHETKGQMLTPQFRASKTAENELKIPKNTVSLSARLQYGKEVSNNVVASGASFAWGAWICQ